MIFESELLIRWTISVVVIILLLAAFFVLLKILKQKGYSATETEKLDRIKLLDQFYIDSKNKIVKVKDGDDVITVLVGTGSVISKEKIKEKSDV